MFETIVTIAGTALSAATGWASTSLIGLGNRVAVLEKGQQDILPLIDAKLDSIIVVCEHLEKRLERVERSMNGHLK